MRLLTPLPCFVFMLAACNAGPNDDEFVAQSSDGLVGGHVATEAEYPATVSLGGCTGVKVGPRHFLAAAHCFGDPNITTLSVTPDNNAQNFVTLSVSSVNIHPQYLNCTACTGDGTLNDFGLKPDVALVIVQELTPSIPQAVIDPTTVAVGAPVTLTGYGCENGVGQPSGPARFKVGDTHAVNPLDLWDPDSDTATVPLGYVGTFGPGIDASSPGLCPGDSGGPLFRTGTNSVIGVNALVSFDGATGTPFGNWHTRLDQNSRYNVYAWVTNLINQPVATPCSSICSPPTVFTTSSFSASYIGTGAKCYETTTNLSSGNCGGFAGSRTLSVNNTTMTCNGQNWTLPAKRNGGYCVSVTSGQNPWAWLNTW